jgi:type II secretory pathway component PulJ
MLNRHDIAIRAPRHVAGFTLIEMMVAIVLGMLVVGAVLAFIFSLVRANSETVLSTRLNQELRGTMAMIAMDVRRARGMADPIAAVGQNGSVSNPYQVIAIPVSQDCIRYSYSEDTSGTTTNFRAIRLNNNKVELVRAATSGGALCTTNGTALNSDGVRITGLSFRRVVANSDRRVEIQLTGELRSPPAFMNENTAAKVTTKTIRQIVSIRSNGS